MSATMPETYAEALGIRAGDLIRTKFSPGLVLVEDTPRAVLHLTRPQYVTYSQWDIKTGHPVLTIRDYPVTTIQCADIRIRGVFRVGDRWFQEPYYRVLPDEVLVERREPVGQLQMFVNGAAEIEPLGYEFDPEINYWPAAGEDRAYRCMRCGLEANLPRRKIHPAGSAGVWPCCPHCTVYSEMALLDVRRISEVTVWI